MNLRNKKLLNTLVAAFVVVVMAGSAFAFVSRGALTFQGVANVNAEIELQINYFTEHYIHPNREAFERHPVVLQPRHVLFGADFTQPGQRAVWRGYIVNTGTMPARITDIELVPYVLTGGGVPPAASFYAAMPRLNNEIPWGSWDDNARFDMLIPGDFPMGLILQPGDRLQILTRLDFNWDAEFTGYAVYNRTDFRLNVSYAHPNHSQ